MYCTISYVEKLTSLYFLSPINERYKWLTSNQTKMFRFNFDLNNPHANNEITDNDKINNMKNDNENDRYKINNNDHDIKGSCNDQSNQQDVLNIEPRSLTHMDMKICLEHYFSHLNNDEDDITCLENDLHNSIESVPLSSSPISKQMKNDTKNKTKSVIKPLKRIIPSSKTASVTRIKIQTNSCSNSIHSIQVTDDIIKFKNLDLVSGVYEGGLKVWECSLDLCHYLCEQITTLSSCTNCSTDSNLIQKALEKALSPSGYSLEIGCGHGLPGCLILREGYMNHVLFSDYNYFVLEHVTLPNALLNMDANRRICNSNRTKSSSFDNFKNRVSMIGGDWMELSTFLLNKDKTLPDTSTKGPKQPLFPCNGKFDLIIAAETTYTPSAAKDTAILLSRHLKVNTGIGLLSMKRYYFGGELGGGVDAFCQAAQALKFNVTFRHETDEGENDVTHTCRGKLEVKTIQIYDNGKSNIRELLQVRCISM